MAQISISQTPLETQQRSFEKKAQAMQNDWGANEWFEKEYQCFYIIFLKVWDHGVRLPNTGTWIEGAWEREREREI